jgi:predicted transcriptional regulator
MIQIMNKVIELVNIWAKYEDAHPNGSIDEFCHHYITENRAKVKRAKQLGGNVPPDSQSIIAKTIGRVAKLHVTYAIIVLKECGLSSFDEFLYLNSIAKTEAPRKTKVIYDNFNELSSGLLILDRLMNKNLISEEEDKKDKRSKRLTLTKKGKNMLDQCYKGMRKVNEWFFNSIPKDDIDLCIHLLSDLEEKFSSKWIEDKEKSYEVLTEEMK